MFDASTASIRALRRPLAACVAACFALTAPAAIADTVFVTSCDDTGPNTLRAALGAAQPGDTVDLGSLPPTCNSLITLTVGAVGTLLDDVTILGPPERVTVTKTATGHFRIFEHLGTGTLHLVNVNIAFGNAYSTNLDTRGGCIYSAGSVALDHAIVAYCSADVNDDFMHRQAFGGGVFATKDLTLQYSEIRNNTVGGHAYLALGGGAVAYGGTLMMKYSTISDNTMASTRGRGGGAVVYGNAVIAHSTISGNHSDVDVGGLRVHGQAGNIVTLVQSTVSANSATRSFGGVSTDVDTSIHNSTIAFNTAGAGKVAGQYASPGLNVYFGAVDLQSSILANNTYGAAENDFTGPLFTAPTGADNLIRASTNTLPAAGLVFGKCAALGSLRDNGGPVKTHALLSSSPAIDAGNNDSKIPFGNQTYSDDQRGAPYARTSGSQTDIGAYEVDQGDSVFNTAFEECG